SGHCGDRGFHVVVEVDAGVELAEVFLPVFADVAVQDVVAAPHADRAAHLLFRPVARQVAAVPALRVEDLLPFGFDELRARVLQRGATATALICGVTNPIPEKPMPNLSRPTASATCLPSSSVVPSGFL